jgi:demethylmenaquinone methyltransferase/2-methoxy-6-polyprenyl-1,4-benzoquinol methylase
MSDHPPRSNYDRLGRWYDHISAPENRLVHCGCAMLAPAQGERILEIGCGTGKALDELSTAAGRSGYVCGVDISDAMLGRARARVGRAGHCVRVELTRADARRLPFDTGRFDAVFMSFALETLDSDGRKSVLAECRRALARGGRIVLVSMGLRARRNCITRCYGWAHRHFPHIIDCRSIDAESELEESGFTVVSRQEASLFGLPVDLVLAAV